METYGIEKMGIIGPKAVYRNLTPAQLVEAALRRGEGTLSNTGALVVTTGKYTGRSPDDKFIVDTEGVHNDIAWGKVNRPISREKFNAIKGKEEALRHKIETETAEAKATAARLESLLVKIHASCGADGRLYGSITSKEIAERLEKDHGISVDKRKIQLSDPIRAYGQYDLDVKLYTDVAGKIHVLVCN